MSISKGLIGADISVLRDKQTVCSEMNVALKPGSMIALMGRNGSGKTTFLEALAGLIALGRGNLLFDGNSIEHLPPHLRHHAGITLIPDREHVFSNLTIQENLSIFTHGLLEATDQFIDAFPQFKGRMTQKAGSLSGGEKRLLCIYAALLAKPKVLMVDEFSEGIQKSYIDALLSLVKQACSEGMAALLVVHTPGFAEQHGLMPLYMRVSETLE